MLTAKLLIGHVLVEPQIMLCLHICRFVGSFIQLLDDPTNKMIRDIDVCHITYVISLNAHQALSEDRLFPPI